MAVKRKDVNNINSISQFAKKNKLKLSQSQEPIKILQRRPKIFPIDALGKDLECLALETNRIVKAPMAIIGQSLLSAISFCTQGHANVVVDSMIFPLSLFFFTVAISGERKSAVDGIATSPIHDYEKVLHRQYVLEKMRYDADMRTFKKGDNGLMIEPLRPREPTLIMNEPTFEGIVKSFDTGQPSLALFSDEGGHFLSGYSMQADHKLKTTTGLCNLWDGSPISKVRASEANIKLYDKRLAFHLMIQPGIATKVFGDVGMVDQGFMSRCLISYPESTMGDREYVAENIFTNNIYLKYHQKLTELLSAIPSGFRTLKLTPAAKEIYLDFYEEIERQLVKDGYYRNIAGFANKMLNQACRIAGVLTLYIDRTATDITDKTFFNACRLVKYYMTENMRLVGEAPVKIKTMEDEQQLNLAIELWNWIKKDKNKKHISDGLVKLRVLVRNAPRSIRFSDTLKKLMAILTDYEYVESLGDNKNWKLK
jgi:hypothetical protein